jgi:hypothetical protein
LSEASHAADTARRRGEFQTLARPDWVLRLTMAANFAEMRWRVFELKDFSRRVRKLRRKVYRQTPVATSNRIAELDRRMSYADMATVLEQANLGVSSGGAALALWRACSDRDLRAWCYEFGFPESLTHTATIVEIDGVLEVHDAFFNLSYPLGLHDMLDSLRDGNAVNGKREIRDRKIYVMDPACEPEAAVRWLKANADRELEPVDGLRRFELLWNPEAFTATCPGIDTVSRELATRGHPGDLQFLMLHPVAVFDGENHFRDRISMPLVGGRDLESPVAALRVAVRDLETERTQATQRTAAIARLETDLAEANSRLSAASQEADRLSGRAAQLDAARDQADQAFAAERQVWMQQKAALQAGHSALEGELARTRSQLSAAVDLRAQRESQVAQLRAEIEDARQQFELERNAVVALESQRQDREAAHIRLESENHDLRSRLEAGAREQDQMRERAALMERLADAAQEHAIEITHYIAPLVEEVDQLRRDYRSLTVEREALCRERARLEAQIAASPGARLRSLWRRFRKKWQLLFRAGRVPHSTTFDPRGGA